MIRLSFLACVPVLIAAYAVAPDKWIALLNHLLAAAAVK